MNSFLEGRIRQLITKENNRKEVWLQGCCNILYPTLNIKDTAKVVKAMGLTIYKNLDSDIDYLAYSNDFVEEQYIDYIASFYKEGYTLPTYKNGSLVKTRHYYE